MKTLTEIGFAQIGNWELTNNDRVSINFTIPKEHLMKKGILYCFCVDNIPHYFGITDNTLNERMGNYKSGKAENESGSTNKKIHSKIIKILTENKSVDIYMLFPKYDLIYEGFEISLHKGIEYSLIQKYYFDGIWNTRGTYPKLKNENISRITVLDSNSFAIEKRGSELVKKGVIQIPKKFQNLIPINSCDIKLYFSNLNKSGSYRFTLSGNNRKINAKNDLIDWIQSIDSQEIITVEIINMTEFKIGTISNCK